MPATWCGIPPTVPSSIPSLPTSASLAFHHMPCVCKSNVCTSGHKRAALLNTERSPLACFHWASTERTSAPLTLHHDIFDLPLVSTLPIIGNMAMCPVQVCFGRLEDGFFGVLSASVYISTAFLITHIRRLNHPNPLVSSSSRHMLVKYAWRYYLLVAPFVQPGASHSHGV